MNDLIINADDFGASCEINEAIIYLLNYKYITSSTIMLGMPYSLKAIEYIHKNNFTNIGLHLNLNDGFFIDNSQKKLNYVCEYNNLNLLYQFENYTLYQQQIEMQIKFILDKIDISHIDGHRHIQIYPVVMGGVIRNMKLLGIKKMRREYTYLYKQNIFKRLVKKYIINKILNSNLVTTDYFFDLNYFIKNSEEILMLQNKTIEIMCHPSVDNRDYKTLLSNDFCKLKSKFNLISYRDL